MLASQHTENKTESNAGTTKLLSYKDKNNTGTIAWERSVEKKYQGRNWGGGGGVLKHLTAGQFHPGSL